MAVYYLVNAVSVSLVIALVEGERFGSVFLPPLGPDSLHWATNVALGTLVAVMWLEVPEALPLLVAPLVLAFFAYRGWVRSMRERDRMQELARTADEISEQNDLEKRIAGGSGGDVDALADTLNRMLDRLERSYRQERRFISEASHELRTPITICRGHLEVLGPDPDPQELRDTLQVVLDELDRMGRILGDLTTLARVADPSFVRPEPVPLESFLQSVAAKAVPLLDGRLRVAPVPAGSSVRADPQRLTQALLNLLHNSARHGRGDAPVRLRTRAENGGWRIEVADSGGGLPPGTAADEVFRPFTRAAGGPGSGLGLAIVRRIAEAHGGAAGLENRPGDGVTVWIRLPG
jgi:two-component system, OmpR family, sensor kinase